MLSAYEVAQELRRSVNWVYRNKKRLGCLQLMPGGAVMFPDNCIEQIRNQNAISNEEWKMARKEDDRGGDKNALIRNKNRGEEMGGGAKRRKLAGSEMRDPFNLLA